MLPFNSRTRIGIQGRNSQPQKRKSRRATGAAAEIWPRFLAEPLESRMLLSAVIANAGFEAPILGLGQFKYNPAGATWVFSGASGIAANNSPFTGGNSNAPEGAQVAFIQNTGSFSQSVTGFAASSYVLTFSDAQRLAGPGVNVGGEDFQILIDGTVVGSYNPASTIYGDDNAAFTVTAGTHTIEFLGLNTAGGDNTAFVDNLQLTAAAFAVPNGGFEAPVLGAANFQYDPAAATWVFTGNAGISSNASGFTTANPNAPEGTQVAILQNQGSFNQDVAGWSTGSYMLTFAAAQRAAGFGFNIGGENFQVLIDGTIVGTFKPTSSGYSNFQASFGLTAGTHNIAFQGLNTAGGDNTAFIDQVIVTAIPFGVINPGFETPPLPATSFQYNPSGAGWDFNDSTGIAANGSGFTSANPAAPEGVQVAVLQKKGSFSQTIDGWATGSYSLTFSAAQRANSPGVGSEDFQVLLDGTVIGTYQPFGTSYIDFLATMNVSAGTHTITFQGLNSTGHDNTALIDNIRLVASSIVVGSPGFETPSVGAASFKYNPIGAWTFTGAAGIAANGSPFTGFNPAAPEGTQVAFIQNHGSLSQSVTGWLTGSYALTFSAAQRNSVNAGGEDFQVLVDGSPVGTFKPGGTTYTDNTVILTMTAGTHTIGFLGLDTAGGDNTAFIDNIRIIAVPVVVANPGFEAPVVGSGSFAYDPALATWVFTGQSGITGNGSPFNAANPNAPEGVQVAFLQKTGSFSQIITGWPSGFYELTFAAAQRNGVNFNGEDFQVLVDGTEIDSFKPPTDAFLNFSVAFDVAAGDHTITFQGVNTAGGDNTVFIDNVSLTPI